MKKIRKTIDFPKELIAEITEFQKANYISTFTGALMALVKTALEVEKEGVK